MDKHQHAHSKRRRRDKRWIGILIGILLLIVSIILLASAILTRNAGHSTELLNVLLGLSGVSVVASLAVLFLSSLGSDRL